jgi:hypothetical protein
MHPAIHNRKHCKGAIIHSSIQHPSRIRIAVAEVNLFRLPGVSLVLQARRSGRGLPAIAKAET